MLRVEPPAVSDPGGGPGIPDPLYYISNDLTLRERPGPAAYCHLPGSSQDWSGEGGTEQDTEEGDVGEEGDVEERGDGEERGDVEEKGDVDERSGRLGSTSLSSLTSLGLDGVGLPRIYSALPVGYRRGVAPPSRPGPPTQPKPFNYIAFSEFLYGEKEAQSAPPGTVSFV